MLRARDYPRTSAHGHLGLGLGSLGGGSQSASCLRLPIATDESGFFPCTHRLLGDSGAGLHGLLLLGGFDGRHVEGWGDECLMPTLMGCRYLGRQG